MSLSAVVVLTSFFGRMVPMSDPMGTTFEQANSVHGGNREL